MSIKIGHASIDERGKITGGSAGDQTGREVCTRSWYNRPWSLVLRPITTEVAELSARACEAACANSCIGYDQGQRNTLNTQAAKVGYDLSKIKCTCECDCSSLMTVCAQAAGVNIPYASGNAPTTRTMRDVFASTGAYRVLTETKYLTSDAYLRRGDILVAPGKHTAMALQDGSAIVTAKTIWCTVQLRQLSKGSSGNDVKTLQRLLIAAGYTCGSYGADGDFGGATDSAVRKWQAANGLTADGIVGPASWAELLN